MIHIDVDVTTVVHWGDASLQLPSWSSAARTTYSNTQFPTDSQVVWDECQHIRYRKLSQIKNWGCNIKNFI